MSTFAPVKPLRPAWQIALVAGVGALLISLSGAAILGHDALESFDWRTWGLLGISFAMAFSGTTWAAAQWMSPSGRASFWRPVLALILAVCGLAMGSQLDMFVASWAGICLSIGSMFSLATGLFMLVIFRRTAPVMRQRVSTAVGVLSGFAGFLAIQLHCPINEFWHMLTGHAILPILWGLIGYFVSRLAFR